METEVRGREHVPLKGLFSRLRRACERVVRIIIVNLYHIFVSGEINERKDMTYLEQHRVLKTKV